MTLGNDNGTDGETDGRTDRVRRNMRPPLREDGRIIIAQSFAFVVWVTSINCLVSPSFSHCILVLFSVNSIFNIEFSGCSQWPAGWPLD